MPETATQLEEADEHDWMEWVNDYINESKLEGHFSGSFSASHSSDVFERRVGIVVKTIRVFPLFSWGRVVARSWIPTNHKTDGGCRLEFQCRTNRPLRREAAECRGSENTRYDIQLTFMRLLYILIRVQRSSSSPPKHLDTECERIAWIQHSTRSSISHAQNTALK